ncbi:MAG: hypothetical protein GIW95_06255 [Candidatus Eremiobacteraeota bacterium]|nr:hypothetical protein [Candidatus Eremiobacteraeota bacterium]
MIVASVLTGTFASAARSGRVADAFRPALKQLSKTKIPLLLPTEFGEVALDRPGPAIVAPGTIGADHYDVRIDITPGCFGDCACSAGRIFAGTEDYNNGLSEEYRVQEPVLEPGPRKPNPKISPLPSLLDKRVRLAHGLTGYYSEYHEKEGGIAYLRFKQKNVIYDFSERLSSEAELVRIVNSAINNGPVKP